MSTSIQTMTAKALIEKLSEVAPDVVSDEEETIDLETFRADLHQMIEEVYACHAQNMRSSESNDK